MHYAIVKGVDDNISANSVYYDIKFYYLNALSDNQIHQVMTILNSKLPKFKNLEFTIDQWEAIKKNGKIYVIIDIDTFHKATFIKKTIMGMNFVMHMHEDGTPSVLKCKYMNLGYD